MPKLALIFHLAEAGAEEAIPLVTAERAAQYCAYLESHTHRVYSCVASRPLRLAARLGERLRVGSLGRRFSVGDVYLRGWAGLDTPESARLAITVLVDAGWVRSNQEASKKKVGAWNEEYLVNPAICAE